MRGQGDWGVQEVWRLVHFSAGPVLSLQHGRPPFSSRTACVLITGSLSRHTAPAPHPSRAPARLPDASCLLSLHQWEPWAPCVFCFPLIFSTPAGFFSSALCHCHHHLGLLCPVPCPAPPCTAPQLFLSQGWHDKVPQNWYFAKNNKFILSTFRRPAVYNQGLLISGRPCSSEGCEEGSLPASSFSAGNPLYALACRHSPPVSFISTQLCSLCLCFFTWFSSLCLLHPNLPLRVKMPVTGLGSPPPCDLILTWLHLQSCCSVTKSCLTLQDALGCSAPGFPVLHHLPEFAKFMSIASVKPSSHLILCHHSSPSAFNLSQLQGLF